MTAIPADLITRLEGATGPDRQLDREIMYAVFNIPSHMQHVADAPKRYTESLDAAVSLVPEDTEDTAYSACIWAGKRVGGFVAPRGAHLRAIP